MLSRRSSAVSREALGLSKCLQKRRLRPLSPNSTARNSWAGRLMSTRRAPAQMTVMVAGEDRVAEADDPAETEDPGEEAGRVATGADQDRL